MNALEQLVKDARRRRDASISQAREHYQQTIRGLKQAARKRREPAPKKLRRRRNLKPKHLDDYGKMTTKQAAELVLLDSGPLSLVELTVEVQRRGCRSGDASRTVAHAIRNALLYHEGRFFRDGEGRWAIL